MRQHSTQDKPARSVPPGVLPIAAIFITGASGITYFLVGDLSETEPEYANHVWRPSELLAHNAIIIGVVSMITIVAAGAALVLKLRKGQLPLLAATQIVILTLFASWLGFAYRVMTAGYSGAQLGAGLVELATPIFALVTLALVVGVAILARRQ